MTAVFVEEGPDKGAIWHFGEPNKEQRALAEGKAWADLSHLTVIAISGDDRLKWLHDLTTQYLVDFGAGIWLSAMVLDPQGHVEYQFNVVDDGTTSYLVMDPHFVEGLSAYLNKMRFMLRVEVRDATNEFAVMRAPGVANEIGGPFALVPRAELEEMKAAFDSTAMQVGTWALDAERVAAGRPRHGIDTAFKTIPNELGVLNGAVHMNKGCYRGQETVAKIYNLGKPPRRLVMLHLDGSVVQMPNHGDEITLDGKVVGTIGSVARHYELGPIALALVKRTVPIDAVLESVGVSATQEALV